MQPKIKSSNSTVPHFTSIRDNLSIIFALFTGALFAYLPFKIHSVIWSHFEPPGTLIRGDGFMRPLTVAMAVTVAFSAGAVGLCTIPLLERLRLGREEYSRKYGLRKSKLDYPWEIGNVNSLMFWVGPCAAALTVFYMYYGYAISPVTMVYRHGPFSSFNRTNWHQVNSIDIYCFEMRRSLVEDFVIVDNKDRLDLGVMDFDIYGNSVTPTAMTIARMISQNHIHRVNSDLHPGCHSPDIITVLRAANIKP